MLTDLNITTEYTNCPHCGSDQGSKKIAHIIQDEESGELLCSENMHLIDSCPIFQVKVSDIKSLNICSICENNLPDYIKAINSGYSSIKKHSRAIAIDQSKYDFWMSHGSLVGFDNEKSDIIGNIVIHINNQYFTSRTRLF